MTDNENRTEDLRKLLNNPAGLPAADELQKEIKALYDKPEELINDLIILAKTDTPLSTIQDVLNLCGLAKDAGEYEILSAIPGHPLQTLKAENEALEKMIDEALTSHAAKEKLKDQIWQVSVHDMKKGDLLYPTLKVRYGLSAPHDYLWDPDVTWRTRYSGLMRQENQNENWDRSVDKTLETMMDTLWIESNLLYPLAAMKFDKKIWEEVYQNAKDYPDCLGIKPEVWPEGESFKKPPLPDPDQAVTLGGGVLTVRELNAILNHLPVEITFVDADNQNVYFNEGHKAFKRPTLSLGHEVFDCHPKKVGDMVKGIIEDFRIGKKDKVEIWMNKQGEPYHVTYLALKDADGTYLGTLEIVMPMEFARKHFEQAEEVKAKSW